MDLASLKSSISGARHAIIASLAVAGLCLPLGYCTGLKSASARYASDLAAANAAIGARDARLKEAAARERLVDQLVTQSKEKELLDAIDDMPDAVPSARRVALGCERLRQAGTRAADLPLVCRPAGGGAAQAGAAP